MLKVFLSRQFVAYLLVGASAALLHWLARIAINQFLSYSTAVVLAYGVGMTVAFILNRSFVFPLSDKPIQKQIRDFMLINISFFPVVWGVSLALNSWFRGLGMVLYTQGLAHAIAISLPVLATFLLYKFVAFRERYHG